MPPPIIILKITSVLKIPISYFTISGSVLVEKKMARHLSVYLTSLKFCVYFRSKSDTFIITNLKTSSYLSSMVTTNYCWTTCTYNTQLGRGCISSRLPPLGFFFCYTKTTDFFLFCWLHISFFNDSH